MRCAAAACLVPVVAAGQQPDTTKPYTLPPTTVSVTRAELPLAKVPLAVQTVDRHAVNRYNFSQDQRISIRGFGARSAFAVRGIKILIDGIPQTLPDGQGQLTNLELGDVDHIEVLRGSASALFGSATGGVSSIGTSPEAVASVREDARVVGGSFGRSGRSWTKWQSTTGLRVGS